MNIRKLRAVAGKFRRRALTALRLSRIAARMSRWPAKLPSAPSGSATCFILGNGPSLNADLREVPGVLRMGDVFCVNSFAEFELYSQAKPKYYVFADPMYWSPTSPAHVIASRDALYDEIRNKTAWPLTIYVPYAGGRLFEEFFSGAEHIRVECYNMAAMEGEKSVLYRFFDLGLGAPPIQNVLVAAIFLALRRGYKKIIVLGADHSWHETITLDETNRVCWKSNHFYNEDVKLTPLTKDGSAENIFTMGEIFHALARMFEGYWVLEEYSKHLGAEIVNASSITYIDAFKRKPLSVLQEELPAALQKS